ncbi:cytochrome P450 4d2-like [Anticarsia gemmatalis]|uniref:cytochrome P450 4d2-like n=1 Tax=Anticarsia gemmatalis TaxID=129554 RepID=UPI003F759A56
MLWKIALILIILWAIYSRWTRRRMIALTSKVLTMKSPALPFIGHSYIFLGTDEDRMNVFKRAGKEAIKNGGLISHWRGSQLFIVVADPVAAEFLLKTCLEKDAAIDFFKALLGNGSIFAPVPIWRPRRKMVAPTFSQKNLNSFIQEFSAQSQIMVKQLKSVAGNGVFSIWKYIAAYSMDSACKTSLGIDVDAQLQPEQPFLHSFDNCCRIDALRACQPWLHNDKMFKLLNPESYEQYTSSKKYMWNFMDKIISSKLEVLKKENIVYTSDEVPKASLRSFLEMLIESGGEGKLNALELREEMLVLVLAASDTSAAGAAYTTLMLAKHPDVQEKVYQELREVFGDSDRPVTAEDLPRLKYLDAVLRETLRLYPPVPVIVRHVHKDVTLPSGVTLVEGCGLLINFWAIHRNPKYWGEDAEQFRPERFIDTPLTHPAAFMPFSHGPRACIGYQYAMMSMKTALASLLRVYRVGEEGTTEGELRVKFDVMMKHVDNFQVALHLRTYYLVLFTILAPYKSLIPF